jgi:hypothetical protein
VARQLGHVERLPENKVNELIDLQARFGVGPDPRRVEGQSLYINREFGQPGRSTKDKLAPAKARRPRKIRKVT